LPSLSGENNLAYKQDTLKMLCRGDSFRFGNPVSLFKSQMGEGHFSESHQKKRKFLDRYMEKKKRLCIVTDCFARLSELSAQVDNPPSLSHDTKRLSRHAAKKLKSMNLDERVGKRQITELRRIRLEVQEKDDSSDDEEFITDLMTERDRKLAILRCLQQWQQTPSSRHHQQQQQQQQQIQKIPDLVPTVIEESIEEKVEELLLPELPALEEIAQPAPVVQVSNPVTLEARTPIYNPEDDFFSLLRHFFSQAPNHCLTIPDLMDKVQQWEGKANRQYLTWMTSSSLWVGEIPSAIAFLSGAFPHAQPDGFTSYISCDPSTGLYQWTKMEVNNAPLSQLSSWWLERRSVCQAVTTGGHPNKALEAFRAQEAIRMVEQPQNAFVYEVEDGRKCPVGPLQPPPASYYMDTQMKNLVQDQIITLYSLVQDGLARLSGGRGSLEDVCNLVKESQYLSPQADPVIFRQKVAMALTHFQKGHPICTFDPDTKHYVILKQRPQPTALEKNEPEVSPRGLGQLVQVRTPQGLKLYRLASSPPSSSTTSNTAAAPQSLRAALTMGNAILQSPPRQVTHPPQPIPPALEASENVIVRNADGRLVRMPKSMLKRLIGSNQVKLPVTTVPQQPQIAPQMSSYQANVLNMLPTVPVQQEQLLLQQQQQPGPAK
jgi:hypothetical protein